MKEFLLNHDLFNPGLVEVFRTTDGRMIGRIFINGSFKATTPAGRSVVFTDLDRALQWLKMSFKGIPEPGRSSLIREAYMFYTNAVCGRQYGGVTPGMKKEFMARMEAATDEEITETITRLKIAINNNSKK